MLRGRVVEKAAIDGLLSAARERVSGALVLRGEPGIGKTALLDYAQQSADGMRVLRCTGAESEAALPYAGLSLVLRPILNLTDALPAAQRRALDGAFGLAESGGDQFAIGAAVLTLLAEAAEQAPLLCLVDDAHWLDRSSLSALLFAARRLDREGAAIVFATRDYADTLVATGLQELTVTGLDADDAALLLAEYDGLTDAQRTQLIAETHGNPLALRELPALAATSAGHGPLPLTSRVLDAFHHQIRALPRACQTILLIAAADDTGDLSTILAAAADMATTGADLQPAEENRLVTVSSGTLSFRHPLVRSAVYHGALLGDRLAAHAALASVYGSQQDADRRAWHLAVAVTGRDEQVAADLEQAADRAVARGSFDTATSGYERAAQLSEDAGAATPRLIRACETALHGGRPAWARSRAERALPAVTDPAQQARLIAVRARAEYYAGSLQLSHDLLSQGAELVAEKDPERAFWLVAEALHTAWSIPADPGLFARTVDQFDAVGLPADHPLNAVAWLARWGTAAMLGRDTTAYPPLDELISHARSAAATAGPRILTEVANCLFVVGRDADAVTVATENIADARSHGAIEPLADALGVLTLCQSMLGRPPEALVSGTESARLAEHTGLANWTTYAAGTLAYVAAVGGDETACLAYAQTVADDSGSHLAATAWSQVARGLLDLGYGRVQDAFDRLLRVTTGPARLHDAIVRSLPDLVEAAARLGRAEEAADALTAYQNWARVVHQQWVDAVLARCRAVTAADSEAEPHFLDAISLHNGRPFDLARTELLYGEWLRRMRRKTDARIHLDLSLQAFEDLGCTPWAARARTELSAAGATASRLPSSDVFASLTPQELQIVMLATQRMSNRDIAAQLFLSPRTVAYHLYKAYPKLGISSRADLRQLGQLRSTVS
jgi:DNA-binding CsgD family transcriptional regulator